MTKGPTKDKITISIDKELHKKLKEHCDKHLMKLSTYIEYLLRKHKDEE